MAEKNSYKPMYLKLIIVLIYFYFVAKYIAPEEQHGYYFKGKNWTPTQYPGLTNRKKNVNKNHSRLSDGQVQTCTKQYLKQINDVKKKLQKVGIDYNFVPHDMPSNLKLNNENTETNKSNNEESPKHTEEHSNDITLKKKRKSTSVDIDVDESEEKPIKLISKKLEGISKKPKGQKIDLSTKKLKMIQKGIISNEQVQLTTVDAINKSKKKMGIKRKNLISLK